MPRLTAEQWEKARAEYEVRGRSLGEIAKVLGVATSSVSRKAKGEGWEQGKMQGLVEKKVACAKALHEVETQTQGLPLQFQHTIETAARERLQAEGLLASFDVALAIKGRELAAAVESAEEFEVLARGRRHLAPQLPKEGTTVNVSQAQGVQVRSPKDVLAEIVETAREGNG